MIGSGNGRPDGDAGPGVGLHGVTPNSIMGHSEANITIDINNNHRADVVHI